MSSISSIGAPSRVSSLDTRREGRARVLEYLSKASSALEGAADELERGTLVSEDHESVTPALQAVNDAVRRLHDAIHAPPVAS